MSQTMTKSRGWLKTKKQVRTDFGTEDELRHLGESLKKRQLHPILAQPDGTIIDGERRFRAAALIGLDSLEVKIADAQLSDGEVTVWQLVSTLQRADLTPYEKWVGFSEWLCMNPGAELKDLAETLSVDPSTVSRYMAISRLCAEGQDAFKTGTLSLKAAYAIAQHDSHDEQRSLLALTITGLSGGKVEEIGRRRRNGRKPKARISRVKCDLPDGIGVVVSGQELSLERLIEILSEVIKAVRRAISQGLSVKEFQSVNQRKVKSCKKEPLT